VPANDPTGRRFGEAAEAYERGRPEYPSVVVDWLLADRPRRVVDLGAGTGKLTRALMDQVPTVVAVEPDPAMRTALAHRLPGASVIEGTGEDIPLRDGFADAVLAGQAWHWVDPVRALPEVARVLRPGGVLGLVWNDRDERDPWVDRLGALLVEFGTSPDGDYEVVGGAPFGPFETTEHRWTHHVTIDGVIDLVVSRSYVIALPEARRAELVQRVRDLAVLGQDPATGLVPIGYVTHAYLCRLPG
jgi:SAM-dependent methyltransferase